ncbi:uncharacterized protein METZ01_LOCUS262777 [marine metagenome]|uniref:Uncharacterized protein n=1 Tax=marine metagenome TaxID=408172 RepID=A0A382JFJ2_9ZZZZ
MDFVAAFQRVAFRGPGKDRPLEIEDIGVAKALDSPRHLAATIAHGTVDNDRLIGIGEKFLQLLICCIWRDTLGIG